MKTGLLSRHDVYVYAGGVMLLRAGIKKQPQVCYVLLATAGSNARSMFLHNDIILRI